MMNAGKKWLALAAALVLSLSLGNAQQRSHDVVQLTRGQSGFKVEVLRQTTLLEVLRSICSQTQTRCQGLEQTASFQVTPSSLSGDWASIISSLMDGTGLNYVAQSTSSVAPTSLIIEGKATKADPPSLNVQTYVPPPLPQTAEPMTINTDVSPNNGSTEESESAFGQNGESAPPPGMGSGGQGFASANNQNAAETAPQYGSPFPGMGAERTTPSYGSAFPDSSENPKGAPSFGSPFPDPNSKPNPAPTYGSAFPG